MMNYKILINIGLLFYSVFTLAQEGGVGINTNEPTHTLDVDGNLRIRKLQRYGSSRYISANADGVIGYSSKFSLANIDYVVATEPVNIRSKYGIIDDQPLGLKTKLIIPANTEAKVVIEYSVPLGIVVGEGERITPKSFADYAGVRFMRKEDNSVFEEADGGSRKYSIDAWADEDYGTMLTVTNKYVENFKAEPNERTIEYALNAYLEHWLKKTQRNYRFNMYSDVPGQNRNWGKAVMTQKVYFK